MLSTPQLPNPAPALRKLAKMQAMAEMAISEHPKFVVSVMSTRALFLAPIGLNGTDRENGQDMCSLFAFVGGSDVKCACAETGFGRCVANMAESDCGNVLLKSESCVHETGVSAE